MTIRVIILNGGSSSGKSSIVRCLQRELPDPWLTFGCDSFVDALPPRMRSETGKDGDGGGGGDGAGQGGGIAFGPDGDVSVGADFRELEEAWTTGIAAMVHAGARIVVDEVFLGGAASQDRWLRALDGTPALWVGVRCEPAVAAARESARGDRNTGMAVTQSGLVHRGVRYDLEVDTSRTTSQECARSIAARLGR